MKFAQIKTDLLRYILLLLVSFSVLPLKAEEEVETLFHQYQNSSGAVKIETANKFFEQTSEFIDTLYYCDAQTDQDYLEALMLDVMGNWYYYNGNYEKALQCITKGLKCPHVQDSLTLYADCVSLASVIYVRLSDFQASILYAEESLRLDRESGVLQNVSSSLNNIAGIFILAGQPEEAEKYILEAMSIERTLNRPHVLAIRLGIAAEAFLKSGKLDEALSYAIEALEVEDKPESKGVRQSQLAAVLTEKKQYDEAYPLLLEAKASLEKTNNENSLAIVLGQLSHIAELRGNQSEAIAYLEQSLAISKKNGNKLLESRTCYSLYQNLRNLRPQEALTYLEHYVELNDELFNEKMTQQLQSFNVKYETAETQHQLEIQNELLQRYRLWNFFGIGVLCVLILVSVLLARLLKIQNRNNKILQQASMAKDELLRIANEEKLQAESARQQILQVADHFSALSEIANVELTKRELQIIRLYCRGVMSKEIADQLKISVRTVETHKAHIYRKLGISTSVELLRFAEQKGLIDKE